MSAPSITASQTDFCDAMSHVNVTSEPNSGYDTPVPRAKISNDTINTLNSVSTRLAGPLPTLTPGTITLRTPSLFI